MLGPGGPPGPEVTWSVEFQMLPVGPPSNAVYFPFWPTVTVQCAYPCVRAVGPHDTPTLHPVEFVGPLFAAFIHRTLKSRKSPDRQIGSLPLRKLTWLLIRPLRSWVVGQ